MSFYRLLVNGLLPTGGTVDSLRLVKLLYKPFGLILGIIGGLLGKQLFDYVWTKLDDEEPPEATTMEATWPKVLAAAAVEGVSFKLTRAAVDRYGAKGWYYLTGAWPGEERPDPED
jgi:xanthosine utilization system XapX-like protein